MEESCDPRRIGDFSAGRSIRDVERVDRRAFFRTDARERDGNVLLAEGGEQFVKQSEPIRRLDLDKGVSRMRFIFHSDAGGKTKADPVVDRDAAMGTFEQRREI